MNSLYLDLKKQTNKKKKQVVEILTYPIKLSFLNYVLFMNIYTDMCISQEGTNRQTILQIHESGYVSGGREKNGSREWVQRKPQMYL